MTLIVGPAMKCYLERIVVKFNFLIWIILVTQIGDEFHIVTFEVPDEEQYFDIDMDEVSIEDMK